MLFRDSFCYLTIMYCLCSAVVFWYLTVIVNFHDLAVTVVKIRSLFVFILNFLFCIGASDQISRSVVSDSFRPHESRHASPPCPSPTPGVHWDSCPSSWWCHPAISSRKKLIIHHNIILLKHSYWILKICNKNILITKQQHKKH